MPENGELYGLFQQDFHQYYDALCQYAFTMLKDATLCEDIVQEVFLRVWEKKQNLIGNKELRFYLFTAVRNNCLTAIEKNRKRTVTSIQDYDATEEQPDHFPDTRKERTFEELISEALDLLPPKCREVFVLSRMSKLTYQQIGDTLGISVKTVENQMGKALKTLRVFVRERKQSILIIMIFFLLQ